MFFILCLMPNSAEEHIFIAHIWETIMCFLLQKKEKREKLLSSVKYSCGGGERLLGSYILKIVSKLFPIER